MTHDAHQQAFIHALERPRLFQLIDKTPYASYLVAAGGYGKSTLVHSYSLSKQLPLLSILIPESGMSVGEFFYKLRQTAIAVLGKKAADLPILSADCNAAFIKLFAEQYADLIGQQAILFLDDVHKLADNDPLQQLIQQFTEALAGRAKLILASRREPSALWTKLRSQGQLAIIDENQLAFTQAEASELLKQQGLPSDKALDLLAQIGENTAGWPIALILLIEHWQRTASLPIKLSQEYGIEDWFLQEVFQPLQTEQQQLLLLCAIPDQIPVDCVVQATGIQNAATMLKQLSQQHAFVFYSDNEKGEASFRLHDLYRHFLRQRLDAHVEAEQKTAYFQQWSQALWQQSWHSLAAPLFIESQNWQALSSGIEQVASNMLSNGLGDKLYTWLSAIPEDIRRQSAKLRLWEGACLILANTQAARILLSSAWQELAEQQDYIHMAIAWSSIVDSIWLEWAHVSLYEQWIDEFNRFEQAFRQHLPLPLWHTVLRGILTATCYGRPNDASLALWEREAFTVLVSETITDNERVMLASQLMYVNTWQFGRRAGASRVMTFMRGQQEAINKATPLAQCLWKTFTALWAFIFAGDKDGCLAEADIGRDLIRRYGISTWDDAVPALHCALAYQDKAVLDDWITWFMRTEPKTHRPFYDTFQAHFLSAQAWLEHDTHAAISHAKEAIIASDRHGSIAISALFRAIYAGLLAENKQFKASLATAKEARALLKAMPSDFVSIALHLNLAKIALYRDQTERALPYLRLAFAAGERQRLFLPLFINDKDLAVFCALMLAENKAHDYCLWHIEQRQLLPPKDSSLRQHWPWFTTIKILGEFTVQSQAFNFQLTPINKPISRKLLGLLVVAGSAGVSQETLVTQIWPDSEQDKALNSLYVNLHRLRKNVFGHNDAIVSDDGRVRLNPDLVRVDAWQLLSLANSKQTPSKTALEKALTFSQGLPQLYDLGEVEIGIWRIKFRAAFEKLLCAYAAFFEQAQPQQALEVYHKGLAYIPLNQRFWQGVLRCEAALGNQQAVHENYQLLSSYYQQELDIEPPKELQDLFQHLTRS